ncbi:MAG: hypothetical protein ACTHMS_23590 [Jatrophihabitans sp.]|uniref:hypothetical protein n=1 Tax=Jatrophihabitans sp. TaxID=1932789 RepID=UPI003F7D4E07
MSRVAVGQLELPRAHDLPPRWDGHRIEWHGWHAQPAQVFICPPSAAKPQPCVRCGSMTEQVMNRGTVWVNLDDLAIPAVRRGRLHAERVATTLMAFRCVDCHHDQVHDMTHGDVWDLDPTDYADEGSWQQ